MKIAVCDDKQIFLDSTVTLLENMEQVRHCDAFHEIDQLFETIEHTDSPDPAYDVIIMDIQWNGLEKNGIEYAARINQNLPKAQIIFMTAYNDRYSQEIFFQKLNLCGYLVKPIQLAHLKILLDKAQKNLAEFQNDAQDLLLVQYNGITEKIPQERIFFLESNAHRITIHTEDSEIVTYGKLTEYRDGLSGAFLTVHKSYIVNMDKIQKLEKQLITLSNGKEIPISKSRVQIVREYYLRYMQEQL